MFSRNAAPYEAISLRQGGYALPSVAVPTNTSLIETGELTRLDAAYNVVWRYLIPPVGAQAAARQFTQVRELADGTLLALARAPYVLTGRTFWLYRFDGATGALLAVYPFTSAFAGQRLVAAAHLLPVAADSTLLVVGQSVAAAAPFDQGVYIARVRIPSLPRVVTGTMPGRAGAAALGLPYPNPADRNLQVAYALPEAGGAAYLELRDVLGRVVHRQLLAAVSGKAQLPVGQLGQGLYTCVLVVNGKVQAARRVAVVR